jgi:hypothetical protein
MAMYIITKAMKYRPNNPKRAELEKLEADIKEIMRQYGHLGQDPLYKEIKAFLDLRPEYEQKNSYEALKTLWNIKKLVKDRQDELRAKLKSRDAP